MTARPGAGGPSVSRSTLLAAAGEAIAEETHEYVPDENDLTCTECPTPRGNWRHDPDLRVAVVVRNPTGQAGPIPREWVSVQFEIPLPRPSSP